VLLSERYIPSLEPKGWPRASFTSDAVRVKLSSALRLVKNEFMLVVDHTWRITFAAWAVN
jgi:hypothetical protein